MVYSNFQGKNNSLPPQQSNINYGFKKNNSTEISTANINFINPNNSMSYSSNTQNKNNSFLHRTYNPISNNGFNNFI